ncbi:hypothetical protein KAI46_03950 [bacterium]|nr:hypothetical protein [bacterium]
MSVNKKTTSDQVANIAARTLLDPTSSKTAKSLAASLISQTNTTKQTGEVLETMASSVLKSSKYNADTKTLAASVLSQSNKER